VFTLSVRLFLLSLVLQIKTSISSAQNVINISDPKAKGLIFSVAAETLFRSVQCTGRGIWSCELPIAALVCVSACVLLCAAVTLLVLVLVLVLVRIFDIASHRGPMICKTTLLLSSLHSERIRNGDIVIL
jgi:hypothetical protein